MCTCFPFKILQLAMYKHMPQFRGKKNKVNLYELMLVVFVPHINWGKKIKFPSPLFVGGFRHHHRFSIMQQPNMEEKTSTQGSAYGRDVNLSSGRGFPSLPIYRCRFSFTYYFRKQYEFHGKFPHTITVSLFSPNRISTVPEMLCLQD